MAEMPSRVVVEAERIIVQVQLREAHGGRGCNREKCLAHWRLWLILDLIWATLVSFEESLPTGDPGLTKPT